jgi:4-amino-4-deoxychorismate lyase
MHKLPINNLINGIAADYLNINDRAIHYGDGLFETILCTGNKLLYWQQHYQRLQLSAEKLSLSCPHEQLLLNDIRQLIEQNKNSDKHACAVKIILTRGAGERGYRFTRKRVTNVCNENRLVMISALESNYSSLLSDKLLSGELYLCEQQVSINESLAGLKHLNRLENVLARNEWNKVADDMYIDGLMVNAKRHVIEGTMSNLFAVKDSQLFTPDLAQSGVKGIMRDVIIALAKKNNIKVSIINASIDDLFDMDELFISNSLIGIKSVTKFSDCLYKDHSITNTIFNDLLKTKSDYVQYI